MSAPAPVFSEQIRLHQIGAGLHRTLEPDQEVRARIAKALDLQALDSFVADLELTPSASGWTLSGRVRAEVVQTCGLTLEPLPATVDQRFSLGLTEAVEPSEDDEIDITMDDESPDPIEDGRIDLGQYAVEQLALALDPFPRKAGATFVQPQEPVEISPFAALKALQDRKPSDES